MADRYASRHVQRSTRKPPLLTFGGIVSFDALRTDWRRAIWCWTGRGVQRALLARSEGRCVVKARRPACDNRLAAAKGRMLGAIARCEAAGRQRWVNGRWLSMRGERGEGRGERRGLRVLNQGLAWSRSTFSRGTNDEQKLPTDFCRGSCFCC